MNETNLEREGQFPNSPILIQPPPLPLQKQRMMSNHYSAATLTPIKTDASGAENLVKNEPRVNGFGAGGGGGGGRAPGINPGMANPAQMETSR